MPKCAICLTRDANQTGSHMLSAFMIESTVGKRGEELCYIIDEEPDFDYLENTGAAPVVEDYISVQDVKNACPTSKAIFVQIIATKLKILHSLKIL